MPKNNNPAKRRRLDLELMRVIAIIFVIFNHVNYKGYLLFAECDPGTPQYWIYSFISILCKMAVPVFFAISGALLLGKQDTRKTWLNRIIRMMVVLIVVSLGYYIFNCVREGVGFNFKSFLKLLYSSNVESHLWYLYAYLAFLISLPILRALVKGVGRNKKIYIYTILVALFIVGIIPAVDWLLFKGKFFMNSNLKPGWIAYNIFLYPMIGYYLDKFFKITKKRVLLLWVLNTICIVLASFLTLYRFKLYGEKGSQLDQVFHNNFAIINLICIFVTAKYACMRFEFNKYLEKLILSIGECTFGIYLIHIVVRQYIMTYRICEGIHSWTHNYMLMAFVVTFIILAISYVLTYIVRMIPVVRKYI